VETQAYEAIIETIMVKSVVRSGKNCWFENKSQSYWNKVVAGSF